MHPDDELSQEIRAGILVGVRLFISFMLTKQQLLFS